MELNTDYNDAKLDTRALCVIVRFRQVFFLRNYILSWTYLHLNTMKTKLKEIPWVWYWNIFKVS